MVTHIVFWKLISDESHGAYKNAEKIKQGLEALVGVVPGLLSAEVGQALAENGEYDLCLLSTFENRGALEAYRTHPAHVEVANFVHTAVCARTALDFESDRALDGGIDPYVF